MKGEKNHDLITQKGALFGITLRLKLEPNVTVVTQSRLILFSRSLASPYVIASLNMISTLSFNVSSPIPTPKLGARLGRIALNRSGVSSSNINIDTPGLLTTTSRGVVPHLSRDHVDQSNAIRWVHIPFETL